MKQHHVRIRLDVYLLFAFLLLAVLPAQAHNAPHHPDAPSNVSRFDHAGSSVSHVDPEAPVLDSGCPQNDGHGCCCSNPTGGQPADEPTLVLGTHWTLLLAQKPASVPVIADCDSAKPLAALLMH